MKECDGVFEGGGVKGIGLAGAIKAFEDSGYIFKNVAGSSVGAIVAALLAAGYKGKELWEEMIKIDFKKFKQKDFLDNFGMPGKLLSLSKNYGIYNADYIENWLKKLLERKGIKNFGDLPGINGSPYVYGKTKCSLQVTTTDLNMSALRVLPDDLSVYNIDPAKFSVATAVRMSLSIPIFYEPYVIQYKGKEHYMVDGGLLSNYPVWILDNGKSALVRPIFGFHFAECENCPNERPKKDNLIEYIKNVVSTIMDAHDTQYFYSVKGDKERTIDISTIINVKGQKKKISTTDFDISNEESALLYKNGLNAGKRFLENWNFEAWKKNYRS